MGRQSFQLTEVQDVVEARTGRRLSIHTLRHWRSAHPAFRAHVGGTIGFRAAAVEMITAGLPLAEIERRLSEMDAAGDGGAD